MLYAVKGDLGGNGCCCSAQGYALHERCAGKSNPSNQSVAHCERKRHMCGAGAVWVDSWVRRVRPSTCALRLDGEQCTTLGEAHCVVKPLSRLTSTAVKARAAWMSEKLKAGKRDLKSKDAPCQLPFLCRAQQEVFDFPASACFEGFALRCGVVQGQRLWRQETG